jgi:hypothetical protein
VIAKHIIALPARESAKRCRQTAMAPACYQPRRRGPAMMARIVIIKALLDEQPLPKSVVLL